ncbi:glycosyltransferase [Dyadobacter sandarakinus]|uniref:Glycosyltransferase n=1 Tax=Dyadobacter sandarakinus TaxID=2747268 RepID=A0ABX7I1R1_9BACT|nr:glycosyltransferase [Dyadobacter sandarakinus]QRQ99466.1 glycosyltransferase [Dyadobacter sandarakinus]
MKQARNILIFCNVSDFRTYTRRATLESIAKLAPGTKCISMVSFWNGPKLDLRSEHLEIIPFYYYLPYPVIKKIGFLNYINFKLNTLRTGFDFNKFDTVILSRPHNYIVGPFIKDKKKVVILSDAYHTMGNTLEETRKVIEMGDVIMATSMALRDVYVQKYFSITDKNIVYWPNCVDLDVWGPAATSKPEPRKTNEIVVGFAGNFMEATDIHLLYDVVTTMTDVRFVLAGKNRYPQNSEESAMLEKIIKAPNVEYHGYIDYNQLPDEVKKWDICIMIDAISEHASYHHHNKMYQYLALGKPVVYQKNHNDYEPLGEASFGVTGSAEFIERLEYVIRKLKDGTDFSARAKELAYENSSDRRAEQLLEII